jgi:hypothetical protein
MISANKAIIMERLTRQIIAGSSNYRSIPFHADFSAD